MKKLVSLLVAMLMVFTMNATVFATSGTDTKSGSDEDGNFTLTIDIHQGGDAEGYVYTAYQIFKGDVYVEDNGTKKTLSNIEWGADVDLGKVKKEFEGMPAADVAKSITSDVATGNEKDTQDAKNFASIIAGCLKDGVKGKSSEVNRRTTDNKVENYVINGLAAGYYLVENTKIPEYNEGEASTADAFTRYILQIVGDATAQPKSDVPTSDKKIVENDEKVDVNEAAIGDEVSYLIEGKLPSNFADFKEYYYVFNDTLSKGLVIGNGTEKTNEETAIEVKLVNAGIRKDVSAYFYRHIGARDAVTGTAIKVGIQDLQSLNKINGITVDANTVIEVTYTAVVHEDAEIGVNSNTNDVILDFSNDPNKSGNGNSEPKENPEEPKKPDPTGQTPKKTVETYVTEFSILKVDENGNPLPGVEFELTGKNGEKITLVEKEEFVLDPNGEYWKLADGSYTATEPIVEDVTDEEGKVTVKNNIDKYANITNKYKLTKTLKTTSTAVAGTVAGEVDDTTGRVTFTGLGQGTYTIHESVTPAGYNTIEDITFTISFDVETQQFSTNHPKISLGTNNTLETTIENNKGSLLPSTGGIGTTIFYVVGTVLVLGAAILLVTKRRMKEQ